MRFILFIIIGFFQLSTQAQNLDSFSVLGNNYTAECFVFHPKLPEQMTIRTIDPLKLSNGSFFVFAIYEKLITDIYTKFNALSYEQKERERKSIVRLYEKINTGYEAFHPTGINTFTSKQLMQLPQRNINSIAGLVAGVDSRNGQIPNIKGARPEGTAYFIDGVRVYESCKVN